MLFNVPVRKSTQPNYSQGNSMRSVRDSDDTSLQWKKNRTVKSQGLSDNIGLAQIVQRINKLQRRQIGYQSQQPAFFPFKIYQIGNQSATDVQKTVYATAGVDINSFTYQIRSGIFGYRSRYNLPPAASNGVFEFDIACTNTDNVPEFDSPPVANTLVSTALSNTADVLLYDPTVPQPLPQILLDPAFDALGISEASFWLKIVDSAGSGLYAQLWGRMWTTNPGDPTSRPTSPLPSNVDSSIIPIGDASVFTNTPSAVYQYLSGNLVNRYAALAPLTSPLGPVNIQRGYWMDDELTGQVFYKGDIVIDDTSPIVTISGSQLFGVFTYTGTDSLDAIAIINASPIATPTGWRRTGLVYLS